MLGVNVPWLWVIGSVLLTYFFLGNLLAKFGL